MSRSTSVFLFYILACIFCSVTSFEAKADVILPSWQFSKKNHTTGADTIWFNIDGVKSANLAKVLPEQVAFIQVLDQKQAFTVFGDGYKTGVYYVTTKINKESETNISIQDKVNSLYPPAGSYNRRWHSLSEDLNNGIQSAEKGKWLILINGKLATLEEAKALQLQNVSRVSFKEGDVSMQYGIYGSDAKNGLLFILTKK